MISYHIETDGSKGMDTRGVWELVISARSGIGAHWDVMRKVNILQSADASSKSHDQTLFIFVVRS